MWIVYHDDYMKHRQTFGHPESPERLKAIITRLKGEGMFENVLSPEKASMDEILSVHTKEYVEMLKNFGEGPLDPDTYMHKETFEIARRAAGGTLLGARRSWETERASLCLVRPPGHHAGAYHGGGFCYLNNVAIAAENFAREGKRSAIVDVDLHHGNGTNDIFYKRKDVLYISTHQWGIYPGTGSEDMVGAGEGEGYTVNIPLPSKSGDKTFYYALDSLILPVITQFSPDLLFISLGCDAHYMDPLGMLRLSSTGYIDVVDRIIGASKKVCGGRCAISLEGGYNVSAIAEVIAGVVAKYRNKKIALRYPNSSEDEKRGIESVKKAIKIQKEYWDVDA